LLFIYHSGNDIVHQLLYVDDIVLTTSSSTLLSRVIAALQLEFSSKDLGPLYHYLGCMCSTAAMGSSLQRQYMMDILDRAYG
jgi:histone deacetylase 1/2